MVRKTLERVRQKVKEAKRIRAANLPRAAKQMVADAYW